MCNYQTLFHDDNTGYIVRCNECYKIQVGYGNLMLTFGQEDFDAFRCWVHKYNEEQYTTTQNPSMRCIVVPTPSEGIKLLLSQRELNEFAAMLETADTELRSLEMIKLFAHS